ncbi:MAG: hypothetical protein AABY15_07590 [Nanoarchaeota archaeon]
MPFTNREYRLIYRRKWYAKNRKSEIAHVTRRKKEIKKWLQNYKKNLKCVECGENHPATLEFHHLGGLKKDRSISQMVVDGISINRILAEMEKCKVLCSNCHQKLHYRERIDNL